MNTASPIGSSSGLLNTVDHVARPHSQPAWVATVTGLATSVLIHSSVIALGVLLLHEVPKLIKPALDVQAVVPTYTFDDRPSNDFPLMTPSSKVPGVDLNTPSLGVENGENQLKASGDVASTLLNADSLATSNAPSLKPGDGSIGTGKGDTGLQKGHPRGEKIVFITSSTGTPPGGMPVASKVVFLCDATGTMTGFKFDLLKQQLIQALPKKPTTSFNIVFFGEDKTQAIDKHQLLAATPQNRKKAVDFLAKASTGGSTNPIPGLEQAFALKPEVIWLLSDGEFDNLVSYDDVVRTIEKLNKNREVRVYTILFGDRDERAEQTLKKIASDNGGTFRFVTTEELLK